jgi:hypothetical protein
VRATAPTIALILVLALSGCAGGGGQDKLSTSALIAKAREAKTFARYAPIFPQHAGRERCSIHVGPVGYTFSGVCSIQVHRGSTTSTVAFTQDFGRDGKYTWVVRVPREGSAFVARASGGGLVQAIS